MLHPTPTEQQLKFPALEIQDSPGVDTTSTFQDNLSLPIHRWFRYSAGFSALWLRQLLRQEKSTGRQNVFDPFAGCGTLLLEAELANLNAVGIEAHPFVARVASAKLNWRESPHRFSEYALNILKRAPKLETIHQSSSKLLEKCYPEETLMRLNALRAAWEQAEDASPLCELSWLCLASVLRECSPVGTAQWQYILPKKTKLVALDPYKAFEAKLHQFRYDMTRRQQSVPGPEAVLNLEDARQCRSVPDRWADLVITSPPYANNYDYADATRLEMTFFGNVTNWGGLQEAVRKYLVRSCTQHVASLKGQLQKIIDEPLLRPIREQLSQICTQLAEERDNHGGKKPYHLMIAAYFSDLARVFVALRRITHDRSLMCFVIGDSAPYGIYVPVDRWLGDLALSAGFKSYTFEKTRDRNTKWKNRKHRVPLQEGRLWIDG